MTTAKHDTCQHCGRSLKLRNDGRFPNHNVTAFKIGAKCKGSSEHPQEQRR